MSDLKWDRVGLICSLVEKSRSEPGRTALMKFAYLLKEVKSVPLNYRFTLYVYGPFDSRLLGDLRSAELRGGVDSALVAFSGGQGYVYSPGPKIEKFKALAKEFLEKYEKEISWVVEEFGRRTAGEMEMLSTLVYIDGSARRRGSKNSLDALSDKVVRIKPRLDKADVLREAERLHGNGHLKAVAEP